MTYSLQEKDFKEYVLGNDLLGDAVRWISKNLDPEDVFDKSDLIRLAADNCDNPEEIFDAATLEAWALDNGWVHFG